MQVFPTAPSPTVTHFMNLVALISGTPFPTSKDRQFFLSFFCFKFEKEKQKKKKDFFPQTVIDATQIKIEETRENP